mgnify:CR=1 FL=1
MTFSLDTFDMEAAASSHIDYDQPIPAGTYKCRIAKAEHGSNKAQTGTQLYTQLEVVEGPHKGRRVQTWFKTSTKLTDADTIDWVEKDKNFMGTFFKAALGRRPKQFEELNDQFLKVRVGVKRDGSGNQVKGFAPLGNAVPAVPSMPQATAPVPPSNGTTQVAPSQPWLTPPAPKATVANVSTDDVPF